MLENSKVLKIVSVLYDWKERFIMITDYELLYTLKDVVTLSDRLNTVKGIIRIIERIADNCKELKELGDGAEPEKIKELKNRIKYDVQELNEKLPETYSDMETLDSLNGQYKPQIERHYPVLNFVSMITWKFICGRFKRFDYDYESIPTMEYMNIRNTLETLFLFAFYAICNHKSKAFKTAVKLLNISDEIDKKAKNLYKQVLQAQSIDMVSEFLNRKRIEFETEFTYISLHDSEYLLYEELNRKKEHPNDYIPSSYLITE